MNEDKMIKEIFPNRPWFSVKVLLFDKVNLMYEESIILISAKSGKEAILRAEKIAVERCNELQGYVYTGYSEEYNLFEDVLEDGVELYSTFRKSTLSVEEYIKRYIRTGDELGYEKNFTEDSEMS